MLVLTSSFKIPCSSSATCGTVELTKGGKYGHSSKELLVVPCMGNYDLKITVCSFLKTGISNAMDGTEGDELYSDLVQSLTDEMPSIFQSNSDDEDEEFDFEMICANY